jgi:hypothetical protein
VQQRKQKLSQSQNHLYHPELPIETPEIGIVSVKAAATSRSSGVDRSITLRPAVDQEHRGKCSVFNTDGQFAFPQRLLNWGVTIISIDFHQVIDVHRISSNRVIRPTSRDNGIALENRRAVQRLGYRIQGHVHSEWRKQQVARQSSTLPIDKIVLCQGNAVGWEGNLIA